MLGFGPSSDAAMRGAVSNQANAFTSYLGAILPTTKALLWLRPYIQPADRAEIRMYNREGRMTTRIILTVSPDRPGSLEQFVINLEHFVRQDMEFFSFTPGYASRQVVIANSFAVYLDASYLLARLLIGGIAGMISTLLRSRRGVVESNLHPMAEA
jgi:hypothetical protein